MAPLRSPEQSGISRSIVSWIVGLSLIAVVGLGIGLGLLHAFGLADWNKIQQARDVGKLGGTPTIPEAYQELIDEAAERCPEVPSRVLAAQIAVESGWQADAQSPAGAQGIAQFMPSTWRQYGLDANGDGVRDVWDPRDAIPSAAELNCLNNDWSRPSQEPGCTTSSPPTTPDTAQFASMTAYRRSPRPSNTWRK